MVKAKLLLATAVIGIAIAFSTGVASADWRGLFDVGAREVALRHPDFAAIRNACLAIKADPKWVDLPPLQGLVETKGYGSDNSAEEFSWAVMILTSRTLAGDAAAASSLETLLNRWSSAKAFEKTEEVDDAYYALKRQLLPLAIAYQVLEPRLNQIDSDKIRKWIDPLVRRVDKIFDGDVDYNNHRVLVI